MPINLVTHQGWSFRDLHVLESRLNHSLVATRQNPLKGKRVQRVR